MFNRFTERARKVIILAKEEARRFNHDYIGTEHILLGLIREGEGVAAAVLQKLDVSLENIRLEIEKLVQPGPTTQIIGDIPFTPRAKKALELAAEEARSLGHNYIGTEHLLLGLIREGEGIASQVLKNTRWYNRSSLPILKSPFLGNSPLIGCRWQVKKSWGRAYQQSSKGTSQ